MRRHGGENKTHGTVEDSFRIDSFQTMSPEASDSLCFSNGTVSMNLDCEQYADGGREYVDIFYSKPKYRRIAHIQLARISNGFGGSRAFWFCPGCGERFRYLYLTSSGFRCRKCAGLNYKTQQDWKDCRYYFDLGVQFAREKLGCEFPPGFSVFDFKSFTPDKPKGMHRSTYDRLMRRYERYQEQCREAFIAEALAIIGKGGDVDKT